MLNFCILNKRCRIITHWQIWNKKRRILNYCIIKITILYYAFSFNDEQINDHNYIVNTSLLPTCIPRHSPSQLISRRVTVKPNVDWSRQHKSPGNAAAAVTTTKGIFTSWCCSFINFQEIVLAITILESAAHMERSLPKELHSLLKCTETLIKVMLRVNFAVCYEDYAKFYEYNWWWLMRYIQLHAWSLVIIKQSSTLLG